MNWLPIVGCLLLLPLGGVGCGSSGNIPPAKEVAAVRLVVKNPHAEATEKGTIDVTKEDQPTIDAVIDWLKTVDWSQKGTDTKVADLPPADGAVAIITRSGEKREFGFYWDGGLVDHKNDRLIRGGDVNALYKIIRKAIGK